jgi:hypothetical protein
MNPLSLNRINKTWNKACIFRFKENLCIDFELLNDTSQTTGTIDCENCKFSDRTMLIVNLIKEKRLHLCRPAIIKNMFFRNGKVVCDLENTPTEDDGSTNDIYKSDIFCFLAELPGRNSVLTITQLPAYKKGNDDLYFVYEPATNTLIDIKHGEALSFNYAEGIKSLPNYIEYLYSINELLRLNICPSLKEIAIGAHILCIEDAEELSAGLAQTTSVKQLQLYDIAIPNSALQTLACGLQLNKSLHEFFIKNLGGCDLRGLKALSDALSQHTSLKKIFLTEEKNDHLKMLHTLLTSPDKTHSIEVTYMHPHNCDL